MNQTRIFKGHEMVRQADVRIRPYIRETGVEPAPELEAGEGRVWLKLENQQVTGSFKVRGALNRLLTLSDKERAEGVVAVSAGNHGLGVAFGSERFGVPATIFVPTTVDVARKKALERYPIELRLVGDDYGQAEAYALDMAGKSGRIFLSPYNDPDVIAGQGTIGIELMRQIHDLDVVFVAVGGGGLVSGVSAYIKGMNPEIQVIAVSPAHSPAMFDVLSNTPEEFTTILDTFADSTAGPIEMGSMTIDLCRALIDRWILVEEEEIVAGMRYLFMEHRLVVEGAGALAIAGYVKEQDVFKDQNCALIVCGGNIDAQRFCEVVLTRQ